MNGNDQIIGHKQGTTHPLSGQSLMRASKGVITATSMMKPVVMMLMKLVMLNHTLMLMLMVVKLLMMQRCRDEAAAIVWRDCPST